MFTGRPVLIVPSSVPHCRCGRASPTLLPENKIGVDGKMPFRTFHDFQGFNAVTQQYAYRLP
eukprot:scaffold358455_cov17-Prasinocladus_malaysianus.AAC.1